MVVIPVRAAERHNHTFNYVSVSKYVWAYNKCTEWLYIQLKYSHLNDKFPTVLVCAIVSQFNSYWLWKQPMHSCND